MVCSSVVVNILLVIGIILLGVVFVAITFASPSKDNLVNMIAKLEIKDVTTQAALYLLGFGLIKNDKFYWNRAILWSKSKKELLQLYKQLKKYELG